MTGKLDQLDKLAEQLLGEEEEEMEWSDSESDEEYESVRLSLILINYKYIWLLITNLFLISLVLFSRLEQ